MGQRQKAVSPNIAFRPGVDGSVDNMGSVDGSSYNGFLAGTIFATYSALPSSSSNPSQARGVDRLRFGLYTLPARFAKGSVSRGVTAVELGKGCVAEVIPTPDSTKHRSYPKEPCTGVK